MRAVSIELAGGIKIDVATPPTLTATATGDEKTSKITYTAPVLKVSQNGKELGTLDAAHPALDVPLLLDLVVVKLQIAGLNEKKASLHRQRVQRLPARRDRADARRAAAARRTS